MPIEQAKAEEIHTFTEIYMNWKGINDHRLGHIPRLYDRVRTSRLVIDNLTLLLLITSCPVLANSVDPDQLASEEANGSGSALFVNKYVNFYQN